MSFWQKISKLPVITLVVSTLIFSGCSKRQTRVEVGNREQVLHIANGAEPSDLDPQIAIGEIEHDIMLSLFEGLVNGNPKTMVPEPGVAERWEISDDGKVYTFHLRKNARWSNGDPVTAQDFLQSYHRILLPSIEAQYANMLYPVKNAEEFNTGKIKDFSEVGFQALDDSTFQITLHSAAPQFLLTLVHSSWYPVHIRSIEKCGPIDDHRNRWTLPENMVCNGPFRLKEWKVGSHIVVEKNPKYWDAANVKLREIYFYAVESYDSEERMFRAGQVHTIRACPQPKVPYYQKNRPDLISIYPLLSTYFYRFNVKKAPMNDKRVRQALAMAIDRKSIADNIARAGEIPAFNLTPPDTAGYTPRAGIKEDIVAARKLLAEAGYPDGKGFPKVEVLFNTLESHRAIAEAIQEMWKKNLNIEVSLRNEEWKVYLDSTHRLDYFIVRGGWGGDYMDPNTFLECFVTDNGNNETGWSNPEFDRLIRLAGTLGNKEQRYEAFQKAEAILVDELPILPIYFYTRPRLIRPSVKGYYGNLLDQHPFQGVYLEADAEKK
jgi:oligopeptide transport system substrate-binding protein